MLDEPNAHVWDYLTYYLDLVHAPNFAVLLSGPWGVGKTYLLKAFLKKRFDDDAAEYVYVSLYGLSTIEEIDDALFHAAFPVLTGTAAKAVGRIAKAGLKFLKVDPGDWNVKEFLNKFDAKVYVFDDLERCEAPINKVLGYINQFVEHGGAKVIILANEKEIGAGEDYVRRREKLIGKTLHVTSVFEEAFTYFSSLIDDAGARSFIEANAAEISSLYEQSELNNLRILQQTLWDFERFYGALSPEHRGHRDAMLTLLRLLFALSFELKAARLSERDIRKGRGMNVMIMAAIQKDSPKTPVVLAGERYPAIDLHDSIISNDLLADYLVRGIVNADAIRAELDASRFFVKVTDEQPWRTVWHWLERSDEDFDRAVQQMEKQFDERAFTKDGELLHVLGLRIFLSDREILPCSRAVIVAQGKKYIDDVYEAKTLEFPPPGEFNETHFQGWGGLGIHQHEAAEWKELFRYLKATIERAFEDTYPQKAIDLLSEMTADTQSFYRHVSLVHDAAEQYIREPVMAKLDVKKFVDAYLSLRPDAQHVVMMAIKGRYEHGQLDRELKDELPWIKAIREELQTHAPDLTAIARYRLQKHMEWYMPKEVTIDFTSGTEKME